VGSGREAGAGTGDGSAAIGRSGAAADGYAPVGKATAGWSAWAGSAERAAGTAVEPGGVPVLDVPVSVSPGWVMKRVRPEWVDFGSGCAVGAGGTGSSRERSISGSDSVLGVTGVR
jgi:hypothetical protein